MKKAFALVFILLFSAQPLFSQEFVQDTMTVSFSLPNNLKPIAIPVDSLVDERDELPEIIGRYEITKYLFVPVDLLICSQQPLEKEIAEVLGLRTNMADSTRFKLVIDEFRLTKKTNSRFYPRYRLDATIHVYEKEGAGDSEYLGHLLYETTIRKPLFRDRMKKGFETVIRKWLGEFAGDMASVSRSRRSRHPIRLENFREEPYEGRRNHLYGGMDVSIMPHGWTSDATVYFSHREARRWFFRSGGYNLRYRNTEKYESIEFGRAIDYLFRRLNRHMVLRVKSCFMLGVNRWKDIDTARHEIYDAFIVDYSLSQCLIFNPLDRQSFLFGIGISENVYYIYSRGVNVQMGLMIHLGLKL